MCKIAPSLLAANFAYLADEIHAVETAGADFLHLDIMDGHFVPNISYGMPVVDKVKPLTSLPLDSHLMVADPDTWIPQYAKVSDIVTIHQEASKHLDRSIDLIKSYGVKAGVAVNPATPISTIEWVLDKIDLILIMSVNPGFGGQKFLDYTVDKVKCTKQMIGNRPILIEVDGGVGPQNAGKLSAVGADILVAGTSIFGTKDYKQAINSLKCG